jgi:4-alpha-glucanotransferase
VDSVDRQNKIIGTLVPLSSLSSIKSKKENQGTFETGMVFLDWLAKSGQNAWQLLPLHQTQLEKGSSIKRVPSPYKGYGIGLDPKYLVNKNSKFEIRNSKQIQNTNIINIKNFKKFIADNKDWIQDYALFCALTKHFGTDDWREWGEGLRKRDADVIGKWSRKLKNEINDQILIQWRLHAEFEKIKNKAKQLNILLIGDLPYYISINSPLVWAHQNLFQFEKDGSMHYVSGMPKSSFGRQIWGHPLYKWGDSKQQKEVVTFLKLRLLYLSTLFDCLRLDHAKGFFHYGVMSVVSSMEDKFEKGPGEVVLTKLIEFSNECGLFVYAEDSGENVEQLRKALKKLDVAGIKLFRFAFDEKKNKLIDSYAGIANYPQNTFVYTTTHDTETLVGYLQKLSLKQKQILSEGAKIKLNPDAKIFAKNIRDALITSAARAVILPIQDWLLSTERINIPGSEKEKNDPNWKFKLEIPIEKLPIKF